MTTPSHIKAKRTVSASLERHETLVHMLDAAVRARPDVTAVIYEDRRVTYAELGRAVAGFAAELEAAGARGGRVVVMMPNSIEMDVAILAAMYAGAQAAPVNPFFKVPELEKVLPGIEARVLVAHPDMRDKAEELRAHTGVERVVVFGPDGDVELERYTSDASLAIRPEKLPRADDLALLIFTGGSTGVPKGVDHAHRGLMWGVLQHVAVWPLEDGEERFLNVAPMFHIWGLAYATWMPIYARGTLVMVPRYDPDKLVKALGEHRITVFAGGPAPIYMGLLASPLFDSTDFSALKYCLSGGAPCPEDLHREWKARTGQPLLEGWGMTEGAPFCLNLYDGQRKLLSVGNPVPETEVQVVDVETGERVLPMGEPGEVRVKGPQLMLRYRSNPEETARTLRDGWLYTGDIGYTDEDGFLFLVDRKKDMVIVGGFNVYPREIDEVLFNHPSIREAATVGKPHARLGEVLVAFVVLDAGKQLTEEEFFAYCERQMVKYKRPVEVHFVEALPKTGTNKINRRALREML
ncbi:MAG TPA: AMP-binding protein [Gammaproteobacteria bacterium]|nr:AMP-binding protein [Gammaproteobacteria bacterium]